MGLGLGLGIGLRLGLGLGLERGRHLIRRQELPGGRLRELDGPRDVRREGRVGEVAVQPLEPADDVRRAAEDMARVRVAVQPRPELAVEREVAAAWRPT